MSGYISDTLQATLINGQIAILDAILYIDTNASILGCMNIMSNNFNPNANTVLEFGGEVNNMFSSGSYYNGDQHLIFDATTDLLIKSAVFYAEDPTTITFELRASNGNIIDDTTLNLIQGQQQLTLNFEVPSGNNMQLGISNGNSGLYRNDNGAIYPYNIGSIMNITGSSATTSPEYYYFYYNIEVEVPCDNDGTSSSIINILNSSKKLLSIRDVLGKETKVCANQPLFYFFDDGTIEKKIIFD
jgi:hypothetical protein